MGVTSKPRSKFVYCTSPREIETCQDMPKLIDTDWSAQGRHPTVSDWMATNGLSRDQGPAESWGDSRLKILDSPMRNLFWLTFVPPFVPLRYCLVPTLPKWHVSFRLSSLYLLTDLFEVLIDCSRDIRSRSSSRSPQVLCCFEWISHREMLTSLI